MLLAMMLLFALLSQQHHEQGIGTHPWDGPLFSHIDCIMQTAEHDFSLRVISAL
jgi:hypothetical protein